MRASDTGSASEHIFQSKLQLPRVYSGRADHAVSARPWTCPRYSEDRMIRNIEKLCPEFHTMPLRHAYVLGQREIPIDDSRPDYSAASGVAVPKLCASR